MMPDIKKEFAAARDAWGMNCGPGAFAGVTGKPIDEVRELFGTDWPGYTGIKRMRSALKAAGVEYQNLKRGVWPVFGLGFVQWDGPWMRSGVPERVRYRYTHWIGLDTVTGGVPKVFDVNTPRWIPLDVWDEIVVPAILQDCQRATGEWALRAALEVTRQ